MAGGCWGEFEFDDAAGGIGVGEGFGVEGEGGIF